MINSLLKDKIKIRSFDDVKHNKKLIDKLKIYSEHKDIDNILLVGEKGSSKTTIANILLSNTFGNEIYNLKKKIFEIDYKKKKEEIEVYYSNYHYELDLNNFNYVDSYIIIEFIKQYTSNKNIYTNKYNVLIIKNFQLAPKSIQYSLRRILEKYINTCRFILLSNKLAKIEDAIISRTLLLKLKKINESELKNILQGIIDSNKFLISSKDLNEIISLSNLDIGKSICLLENIINGFHFEKNYDIIPLIELIVSSKKILDINLIRNKIYNILLYIDVSSLIVEITLKILEDYDMNNTTRNQLLEYASDAELNTILGFRSIYHIENFIIKLICLFN